MMARRPSYTAILLAASVMAASAFQLPSHHHGSPSLLLPSSSQRVRILEMASDGENDKVSKRRRRKRKKEDAPAAAPEKTKTIADDIEDEKKKQSAQAMAQQLLSQEAMMFDEEDLTSFTPVNLEDDRIAAAAQKAGYSVTDSIGSDTQLKDIFDSREFLQRKREKQLEIEENQGKPTTAIPTRKKIKRSDIKAYEKLLEMDPIADEDDSYFEDEGIDFISALLGDVEPGVGDDSDENKNKSGSRVQKKTSFMGIGSGPLQVGHFIGALGVVLMAFVEYPGFPLTNLPDPLRGALQGGLGTIYLINAVLAVFSAISAPSRKQSSLLWGAKTFAVGGIAYDQLMAIPTPEELVEMARKEAEMVKRRSGRRGASRQK
mmetsp:Transcript_26591/g.47926  ORF Transcript_26591/g.47926 Transcript_26591/m.47926 type:complete len:375 (-) Transcript_26591:252-1376(-)